MVKFRIRTLVLGVVAGSILLLSGPPPAWAASPGTSLTTSPISVDLNGKPGSSVSTTLQVMNNGVQAITVNVQLDTFKASGTNGQAQVVTPGPSDTFIKWATFSQNSFVAQPGVWTPVKMTIKLPATAALGYYYAVLFKPVVTSLSPNSTVLRSSNAILVLLNAQVANENPQVKVTSFTTDKKLYEYLPASFHIAVTNTGNIYLPPTGEVYISKSSTFSHVIASLNINAAAGNVLPGSSRVYPVLWTDGFPVFEPKTIAGQPVTNAQGKAVEQLSWNFSQAHKIRFGKYYAKMVLVYNNGTQDIPIQSTVSFWVIPWKLLIGVVAFIAFIVGLIVLVIYLLHKLRKQTKSHT